MFAGYKIKELDNEECLFLYIDNKYEFSKEFISNNKIKRKQKKNLYNHIIDYINEHKIKFNGKKVLLILNGFLITTIILGNINNVDNQPSYRYVHSSSIYYKYNEIIKKDDDEISIIKEENDAKITETPITEEKPITKPPIKKKIPLPPEKEDIVEQPKEETKIQYPITLHRSSGVIEQLELEDYITGVVAAEMPALFHPEALRAQAVASRTYALKRMAENKIITDTNAHQTYKDINQLKALWGNNFNTYYNKIKDVVQSTKGQYIAYNNYYIDALFHSTSNGKTEDPINVWGGSFPYLKSVDSHWDLNAITYEKTQSKTFEEVSNILGFEFNQDTNVQLVSKTVGNRVNEIVIGEHTYSGIDIRDLFGLRSADFDINIDDNQINFTTRGYGHGVGMSQYGANGMAKEGYSYRQILNHYYPNTKILTK